MVVFIVLYIVENFNIAGSKVQKHGNFMEFSFVM